MGPSPRGAADSYRCRVWTAFLPAIVLIRLSQPDTRAVVVAPDLTFDPHSGRFAIRYASFSELTIFNLDVSIWVRTRSPRNGEFNNNPVRIRSEITTGRRFSTLRTATPFIVYTDPASDEAEYTEHVREVPLHPGHVLNAEPADASDRPKGVSKKEWESDLRRRKTVVMVNVSGETVAGQVHASKEYLASHILCGSFTNVEPDPSRPKDWRNFDAVNIRTNTAEGREFCLQQCRYRPECRLVSKVPQ